MGAPSTYSDVQVLEEDKQCLPDQLELPSREIPIYLSRQGGGREALHFPLWAVVETGRGGALRGRTQISGDFGSRSVSILPSKWARLCHATFSTVLERLFSTDEQTCTPNALSDVGKSS